MSFHRGVVAASLRRGAGAPAIPSPEHHYDFSDAATLNLSGSAITQCTNKAALAGAIEQFTAARKPTLSAMNGLGAASFDLGDILGRSIDPVAFGNPDQPFTLAIAVQPGNVATTRNFLTLSANGVHFPIYQFQQVLATSWRFVKSEASTNITVTTNFAVEGVNIAPSADPHVLVIAHSGTAVTAWIDGVKCDEVASDLGSMFGVFRFHLGAHSTGSAGSGTLVRPWLGLIGEVKMWTSRLTDEQAEAVSALLMAKWLPA